MAYYGLFALFPLLLPLATSSAHGVFAVVITLLSWLYPGSQLTLWAAEINVVLRTTCVRAR